MIVVAYREQDHDKLVEIWESAVRATHTFLEEHHIQFYKKVVRDVLQHRQVEVWEALNTEQQPVGFIGLDDNFIEMLFVDPSQHGQGLGRLLIDHTFKIKGRHLKVDVNEQNTGAARFYQRWDLYRQVVPNWTVPVIRFRCCIWRSNRNRLRDCRNG